MGERPDPDHGRVWEHGYALDDLPAIHASSTEEDLRLLDHAGSLDKAALNEPLAIGADADDTVPRWLILAHVVNQGTQHRGELAHYLTRCGHSPDDLDLLDAATQPWPGDG